MANLSDRLVQLTNAVEYAAYDDGNNNQTDVAANTDYTTDKTVYGPGGALVPAVTQSLAATDTVYRVYFRNAIQATDIIELQTSSDGVTWIPYTEIGAAISQFSYGNGKWYGISWNYVSGNSFAIDINFGNAGRVLTGDYNSASAGDYATWASANSGGRLYRLVKRASKSVIGESGNFPQGVTTDNIYEKTAANGVNIDGVTLKDGGIVGRTTTPGTGEIGEDLSVFQSSLTSLTINEYVTLLTSPSLTQGVYLVSASLKMIQDASGGLTRCVWHLRSSSQAAVSSTVFGGDCQLPFTTNTFAVPAFRIIVNATGILFPDGAQTTSNTLILSVFHLSGSTTPGVAIGRLNISRIA